MKKRNVLILSASVLAAVLALAAAAIVFFLTGSKSRGSADSPGREYCKKITGNLSKLGETERKALLLGWKSLPDGMKSEFLVQSIASGAEKFVVKYRGEPDENKRREMIAAELEKIKRNRAKLKDEDAKLIREFLTGMDMRQVTEKALSTYQNKCSPQERAAFDPLVHEYVRQYGDMVK